MRSTLWKYVLAYRGKLYFLLNFSTLYQILSMFNWSFESFQVFRFSDVSIFSWIFDATIRKGSRPRGLKILWNLDFLLLQYIIKKEFFAFLSIRSVSRLKPANNAIFKGRVNFSRFSAFSILGETFKVFFSKCASNHFKIREN